MKLINNISKDKAIIKDIIMINLHHKVKNPKTYNKLISLKLKLITIKEIQLISKER